MSLITRGIKLRSFLLVPKELHYLTYLHLEAENLGRKINEQFDPSNDYYTFLSLAIQNSEKRLQTMKIPECFLA